MVGRLRPGVSLAQAASDLKSLSTALESRFPDSNREHGLEVTGLLQSADQSAKDVTSRFVFLLQTAAGFVLLLACVNVANLQLARGLSRERETALRSALGAGPLRLVRLHMAENLLLALGGSALGVGLAVWILDLQGLLIPAEIYKLVPGLRELRLHLASVLFAVAAGLVSALICGIAPITQALRAGRIGEALKESARGNTGLSRGWLRQSMVVAEVALALVLLVSAALIVGVFRTLATADLGYRTEHLLSFSTDLPAARYQKPESIHRFETDALARLSTAGAIQSTAASASGRLTALRIEGMPDRLSDQPPTLQLVSPGLL